MNDLAIWWDSLGDVPPRLTSRQRLASWVAAVVAAVIRPLTIARTPWDLDETLFILAVRDYDVAAHHPHPPGFPLFVAAAKAIRLVTNDEFRALQALAIGASLFVFPAMFYLAREFRLSFATCWGAALFTSFFPTVLLYGGMALSDVPSMMLVVLACALLIHGCRSGGAYIAGAAILAMAASIRPQNLLIGLAPFLVGAIWRWKNDRRAVVLAFIAAVAIVVTCYGGAIVATEWERYVEALRAHQRYITATDSFLSSDRRPLYRLVDDFFVRPVRDPWISIAMTSLVVFSLIRVARRPHGGDLLALAAFGPFALFAWLFLDLHSAGRFSLGYLPLLMILAADGLALLNRRYAATIAPFLAGALFVWMWFPLREIRTQPSPPAGAVEWIETRLDPRISTIYVQSTMAGFLEALAPRFPVIIDDAPMPVAWTGEHHSWALREGVGARSFVRKSDRLWDVARRRYFIASVTPLPNRVHFGQGWYGQEGRPPHATRWMNDTATLYLPAVGGAATLSISLFVPVENRGAQIVVEANKMVIDRFRATEPYANRRYQFADVATELVIRSDRAVRGPGADSRRLALRLEGLNFSPAAAALHDRRGRD